MTVTLREVAELAGVSRSAVSRSFTEGASVSKKTRDKVEKAAQQLGYQPNALASSLTTGRTKLIGLIANNFHNPLFLQVFDRFSRGLQDRGLRPLLINLSAETDPTNTVNLLRQYSVDGAIVASSTLLPGFAAAIKDAGVPVVHSFGRKAVRPRVNIVGIDNQACGKMAADTLIARGYRRIGFLGGPKDASSTQDRLAGFLTALGQHEDVEITHSFAADYTFQAGRQEMLRLIDGDPAEAYFCGDDVIAIGAQSAAESEGLCVPDDIGLLGLNDMEMAGWNSINLTTIHQPVAEIIDRSIDLVVGLNDSHKPTAQMFDCHIVERGTLRAL